jgi:hypothetical protein
MNFQKSIVDHTAAFGGWVDGWMYEFQAYLKGLV